jgi:hypothetical protein
MGDNRAIDNDVSWVEACIVRVAGTVRIGTCDQAGSDQRLDVGEGRDATDLTRFISRVGPNDDMRIP